MGSPPCSRKVLFGGLGESRRAKSGRRDAGRYDDRQYRVSGGHQRWYHGKVVLEGVSLGEEVGRVVHTLAHGTMELLVPFFVKGCGAGYHSVGPAVVESAT